MIVINDTTDDFNFDCLCDKVINGELVIISNEHNEKIVMISEVEYNELARHRALGR